MRERERNGSKAQREWHRYKSQTTTIVVLQPLKLSVKYDLCLGIWLDQAFGLDLVLIQVFGFSMLGIDFIRSLNLSLFLCFSKTKLLCSFSFSISFSFFKKEKKKQIISFFENLRDSAWDAFLAHKVLLNSLFCFHRKQHSKLNEFKFWVSMWSFKVLNDSRNIGLTQKISVKSNGRPVKVIRELAFGFFNL